MGLLEYRDPFFRGGSSLTRLLAAAVGRELGLPEGEIQNLGLAAVLRDLGRLALGGKLVSGPGKVGKTPEARRRIERHVDLALHLMEGIDLPASIRYAVRHHHERWDGGGYPDGLAGAEIPLSARILAVVDSFSAMVAARPYRLPRKVPEATAELRAEAGSRYDPDVVDALLAVLSRRDQPHLGFVQRHHYRDRESGPAGRDGDRGEAVLGGLPGGGGGGRRRGPGPAAQGAGGRGGGGGGADGQ